MNDTADTPDPVTRAFFTLYDGVPRQGPGSDTTTRRLLEAAGPLPERPRVLEAGCGRSALLLAEEAGAQVTAVDLHQPFLDHLTAEAARLGLGERITTVNCSMDRLPFPDHGFDVIWAEGAVYTVGFDTALRAWHRLLAPGGVLVLTEIEWSTTSPSATTRAYWDAVYPLRTGVANTEAAGAAGYRTDAHWPLPESDWWDEYYTPLTERIARADPSLPGMSDALAALREEIFLRREHGGEYRYAAYILRPHDPTHAHTNGTTTMADWATRPETSADAAAIRDIDLAAFETPGEADLVDALRADSSWIDGLSLVATGADGKVVAHALLTRCHIGDTPALCLGPVAVLPEYQKTGAGSAAIRAALRAAKDRDERYVTVLGHPAYYPRFGFTRASAHGIGLTIDVPDDAMMAMALDEAHPLPSGTVRYAAPFGI
ncbi:GNAT family N-acetyltransferase [Streptomyces sp. NPDC004609]|uniref:GNAT family N-acetyltransferase n=1 Tax=Streptomyces sp. NPDC004609 TaxID=3364704 RepID=UPI0036D09301